MDCNEPGTVSTEVKISFIDRLALDWPSGRGRHILRPTEACFDLDIQGTKGHVANE